MYAEKVIEFTGRVKYFEFKLAYILPDQFFSELSRLNNTITEIAGHHRFFRGIACMNIDEWIGHTSEPHFHKLLEFIAKQNDKILYIITVHTNNKRVMDAIESSLSTRIRFEKVSMRFPNTDEIVSFIEDKYFGKHKFILTDDARALIKESIETVIGGKNFNGFTTIKQLANDIIYELLKSDELSGYEISGDMLNGFKHNSEYIRRIKAMAPVSNPIGFGSGSLTEDSNT
jgi:hypothetical protein